MSDESRIFTIAGHGEDFFTGQTADGRQVLLGLLSPQVVLYFFDADGVLLERQARDWEHPAPRLGESDIWLIGNAEFKRRLAGQITRWQQEIGFAPGAIRVRWFFDEEYSVGIATLPESLRDLSWCEDEAERQEMKAEIKEWQAEGRFVFFWAKEYLMAPDGEVLGS